MKATLFKRQLAVLSILSASIGMSSAEASNYDETDAVSMGLKGPVAEVLVTTYDATVNTDGSYVQGDIQEDSDGRISFNPKGQVTFDVFGNEYNYDDSGAFVRGIEEYTKVTRDGQGRVHIYENIKDDEDDNCHKHTFNYDSSGRLISIEMLFWESETTFTYTYDGQSIYPSAMTMEEHNEGDIYRCTADFRYTKFDDYGNWTEREIHTVNVETSEPLGENDVPESNTTESYSIESRDITYY